MFRIKRRFYNSYMLGKKQHALTQVSARPEKWSTLYFFISPLVDYCEKDLDDHWTIMLAAHRAFRSC